MGKALAEAFPVARAVFAEVDDALSQKLSQIMWEGPESDLTLTENAQPAIMAASMAIMAILKAEGGLDLGKHARLVAGHSLGEYSALCAAGAFTLADTARLLKIRGVAMQSAVPVGEGAMTALIGADIETAEAVAAEAQAGGGVCVVANDNAPGQVVISGSAGALARAAEIAKAKGVKRAIPLSVSAPFHCPLMQPAAEAMRDALSKVTIRPPLRAGTGQCHRPGKCRTGGNTPSSGGTGDQPRALAAEHAGVKIAGRETQPSSWAATRFSPAWSSESTKSFRP